jgi:hypothetical protein
MTFTFKLEQADGTPADPPTFEPPCRTGVLATRSRWGERRSAWSASDGPRTRTETRCWSSRTLAQRATRDPTRRFIGSDRAGSATSAERSVRRRLSSLVTPDAI